MHQTDRQLGQFWHLENKKKFRCLAESRADYILNIR